MFKSPKSQAKRTLPVPRHESPQWQRCYNWVLVFLPLSLAGVYLYQADELLPIRSVELDGTFEHLDRAEVETRLRQFVGSGFFSLDIQALQRILGADSWAEAVSVRRVWPDQIRVRIVEKKPVARWDGHHLLSDKAKVYVADTRAFQHLPLIHAANHPPTWVLNQFYRLDARFASVDERLASLEVDSRGALDIELINGLVIKLGRDQLERRIERLIRIYQPQILPRRKQIERLDLRYSNGIAVAWKKSVLQQRDEASIWRNTNV